MSDQPTLIITRGLPGSGKSTTARAWVAADPAHRARINRDDLREQLHGSVWLGQDTERQIIAAQHGAITALLRKGIDVVCDDTNLPQRTVRDLARVAALAGADLTVWDMTDVDLEVCVQRDFLRNGRARVGEDIIRGMYDRYLRGRAHPLPMPDLGPVGAGERAPYVPVPGAPRVVMVDIDGTVALMAGRSPYDETRVHEDRPNAPVIAAVGAAWLAGCQIIFCSGRHESCREATEAWLKKHVDVPYIALYMRADGDMRPDVEVKLDLFDAHIRHAYHVQYVLDDRQQVVDAWRSIGLTVLQVAPGNF